MRDIFHDQLDSVTDGLVTMAELVRKAVDQGTRALLDGDATIAEEVISGDAAVDQWREQIEQTCFELMSLQQPVATDLRTLVAALRMVAELERMGDLAVHLAKIARLRVPESAVPEDLVPVVERMGTIAELMVARVGIVIERRDVEAARDLIEIDEEMDKLRRRTFREVLDSSWDHGVEPAIDIALLGRYYERIADHATSIARRVIFLVTGEQTPRGELVPEGLSG
ncbi:phosphate signaling complex protein PhoU [Nocardioidaceae bacterium]|nr:phosphate signaling complex protein PhoU [Nocardioidaceae bacterium]